jgi:hypothetical protein
MDIGQAPGSLLLFIQPRTGTVMMEEDQPFLLSSHWVHPLSRQKCVYPLHAEKKDWNRGKEGAMVSEGDRGEGINWKMWATSSSIFSLRFNSLHCLNPLCNMSLCLYVHWVRSRNRPQHGMQQYILSHKWLCNCSILNFLIYEENFIFFFISVGIVRRWWAAVFPPPASAARRQENL